MNTVLFTYRGQTYVVSYPRGYTNIRQVSQDWFRTAANYASSSGLTINGTTIPMNLPLGVTLERTYPDADTQAAFFEFITPQLVEKRLAA